MKPHALAGLVACSACVGAFACEPAPYLYPLEPSSAGSGGASSSSAAGSEASVTVGAGVGTGTGTGTSSGGVGASCGFDAASNVTLPSGYMGAVSAGAFPTLQGGPSCASGADVPTFALMDLDGDGALDLVFTSECQHTEVGATAWWWFKGSGGSFATTPAMWTLPTGFQGTAPFAALSGQLDCAGGAGTPTFTLVDMNFDGRPDLLVTAACDHTEVGASVWWMYENTGAGFAASATLLTLPGGFGTIPEPFPSVFGALSCTGQSGAPAFVLADATGDGKPDLVLTETCASTNVGTTSWTVYAGGSTGFSSTPIIFTLPPGYSTSTRVFGGVEGALDCTGGVNAPSYAVVYWNADDFPDLLVTRSCDLPAVGVTEWLLYPGAASGFASTPQTITLPSGYGSTTSPAFGTTSGELSCSGASTTPSYLLVDMNGDGFLDLLVTERCNDDVTGTTRWLVYEGSASGFGQATDVALPSGYLAPSSGPPVFAASGGNESCADGADEPSYQLVDLNGDLRPDIVVTSRCNDTTTGSSRWLLSSSTCQ